MFRGAPGIREFEVEDGPVDESRTERELRFASGLRSAFREESGGVVEVGV
jgi:hypothetical protein